MLKPRGHGFKVYWICKCDCGTIKSIISCDLKSGKTKSCGCFQKEQTSKAKKINLFGKKFGKLTVIKEVPSIREKSGQIRTAWLCKCECGNEVIVKTINLQSGDTKSCGCIYSVGEKQITDILNNLNINYKKEYSFQDLKTKNNFPMRFDFAIFKNNKLFCLIEFQGRQHYEEGDFSNSISLEERQERDKLKREYCKQNNIPLIEIPYWELYKMNEKYIKEKINKYEYDN